MGFHPLKVFKRLKFSFGLFLVTEIIFFFRVFWFFFDMVLIPIVDLGCDWGLKRIILINPFGLPFFNTLLLLRRAFFLTWSHNRFLSLKNNILTLYLTIFLGVVFLSVQVVEYKRRFFSFSDRGLGTIFFMSTGFHGFHVFLGLNFLLFCLFLFVKKNFNFFHHLSFEISIIYWHFVDLVWLFLYIFVYWWSY